MGGHSIGSLLWQAVDDFKQIPAQVFRMAPTVFLLFPVVLGLVWWMKRRGQETVAIYIHSIFLIIFNLFIWYRLLETGQWSITHIGFGGISLLFALMLSAVLTLCAWKKSVCESGFIPFKRLACEYASRAGQKDTQDRMVDINPAASIPWGIGVLKNVFSA